MTRLVQALREFRICSVYLIDSSFALYATKLMSSMMAALSALVKLEVPHVTILSKCDLVSKEVINKLTEFFTPLISKSLLTLLK